MSANLRAFLAMIRWAEGTAGPDGYRTMVGGALFDSFADHPRKIQTIRFGNQEIHSSAAGAYQFLAATWDRCRKALDLPDFSPESQDKAAIHLIQARRALLDVEQGRLWDALEKCSWEWASLPPSRYNQPTKTYEQLADVFQRAGGTITQPAGATPQGSQTPSPAPAPAAPKVKEKIMAIPALVTAAATALLPIIADLFRARGSRTSTRNAEIVEAVGAAAPAIVEIAKATVPDAPNEQAVAERILADPELQKQFRAAVALQWSDVEPFLRYESEEREKARGFAERMTSASGPTWRQIGFGVLIAVLALGITFGIGGTFYKVLFSAPETFSQSTKDGIIQVMINILVLVVGFFFGSSASNRQKDTIIEEQAKR